MRKSERAHGLETAALGTNEKKAGPQGDERGPARQELRRKGAAEREMDRALRVGSPARVRRSRLEDQR